MKTLPPARPRLPVSASSTRIRYEIERRERRLLDAEVVEDRRRLGARRTRWRSRRIGVDRRAPQRAAISATSTVASAARSASKSSVWSRDERLVDQLLADDHRRHRRAAGTRRSPAARAGGAWRRARRLGLARIDDDDGARRVVGQLLEGVGGVVAAVADLAGWCRARAGSACAPCRRAGRSPARRRTSTDRCRLCCVFSCAKALNQRFEPRPRRKPMRVRRVHVVRLAADADQPDGARRVRAADRGRAWPRSRAIAMSQSMRSKLPSARRRIGCSHAVAVLDVVRDAEGLVADVALA